MEIGTVKISVDTTELDNSTKKLTELSQLLDKVQGQINSLSGNQSSMKNHNKNNEMITTVYGHQGKIKDVVFITYTLR